MIGQEIKQRPGDSNHTPFLAMIYQIRTAVADLAIPLLAGLATVWLLIIRPRAFFNAYFFHTKPLESLRSPLTVFWRALSSEERRPLDPAQFLLFGIFAAALAGFNFDNSNKLTGLLRETGVTEALLTGLASRSASLGQLINAGRRFWQSGLMVALQSFLDQAIIAAILELIINLFVTALFAYLFFLLVRRQMSATHSYIFWLYMRGLLFFTTAVSSIFFSIVSLSFLGLPEVAPDLLFWLLESGSRLLWLFLFPALILPRLIDGLTGRRVLVASLIGQVILASLNWLFLGGAVTVLAFLSALTG